MANNDRSIESLIIRYLIARTQCSGCGRRYDPKDVHIQDHRGDIWLASVTCKHCGLQGLIMAVIRAQDAQEVEAIFESDAEEWSVFQQMGPISSDEVLDLHCFLEEFSGDVVQLLEEGDGQP